MLQKTEGIVLRVVKYNDTSNIVDIYTRFKGRASFIVPILKSRKATLRSILFQPLSILEFEADFKDTSDIFKIRNAKSAFPFSSLPYNPYKTTIALFLAEFLYRSLKEEVDNEQLFEYLEASIKWLDESESGFSNFHLVFLMKLSKFLGLFPNVNNYSADCYFDMMNACFILDKPLNSFFIDRGEASMLMGIINANYETMNDIAMSREQRNRLLVIINDYYRLHLPDFPQLKSIDVLKEIFR